MTSHANKPEGAPKGGRPAPPRKTGVLGRPTPTPAQFKNLVLFNCPTCRHENKIKKAVLVVDCERCGNEIDRRPTLPHEQNGLKIDWITCTFKDSKILEALADLKPLEASDIKWIQREEDTREGLKKDHSLSWEEKSEIQRTLCPFYESGLKSTKGGTPFWDKTWEWFRGARVAQGSQGKAGEANGDKSQHCLIKVPGKALDHLRKQTGKTDLEVINFFLDYGGKFSRLDIAIDHLPTDTGPGIINPTAEALESGCFTSTWDKDRTPPKFFTALDYSTTQGEEGIRQAEAIIETITLGSRASETYGRVYDKRRELIATGHHDPGRRWERYELEIKKKRAEALGKEIGRWGKDWKKQAKGLFLKFLRIRDLNHNLSRVKERREAPWYLALLSKATETTLETPRQVKKDREQHRACTIEQSGKRLFKVWLADLQEGGLSKLGETLEALVNQALKGMKPEDWEQIFDHLKLPDLEDREALFNQTNLKEALEGFTEYLKTA